MGIQERGQHGVALPPRNAERVLFFTDAVVAIALTLLILPLMESVAVASEHRIGTGEFLSGHVPQLFSFVLSFGVIGVFWAGHYRLWHGVERMTRGLFLLNFVWLLCMVWLPVATAMVGGMPIDRLQTVLYIGPMLVASLASAGAAHVLGRHPEFRSEGAESPDGRGVSVSITLTALYGIALIVPLIAPSTGYLAMFVLLLFGPIQRVVSRMGRR